MITAFADWLRQHYKAVLGAVLGLIVLPLLIGFVLLPKKDLNDTYGWSALSWIGHHVWTVPLGVLAIGVVWWIGWMLRQLSLRSARIAELAAEVAEVRGEKEQSESDLRDEIAQVREQNDTYESDLLRQLDDERDSAVAERDTLQGQLNELNAKLADSLNTSARLQICHFDDDLERDQLMRSMVVPAQSSILVVGVVNKVLQRLGEHALEPFFVRGGHLRALFIDPDGQEVHTREELERFHHHRDIPRGSFASRTRESIESLRPYRESLDATAKRSAGRTVKLGHLDISVFDRQPSLSLVMVDDRWAMFHYYGLSTRGVTTPTYLIDGRDRDDLADILLYYRNEFESLWTMEGTRPWLYGPRPS